jgi:signal transduction histidine kinase
MQSIQSKLSTGLLFSLIIAFSALWLLVSTSIQSLAEDYIASRLTHDAETLLSAIQFDENDKLIIDPARIDLIYNQPFSGHYYAIDTATESVSSRSLWDQQLKYVTVDPGNQFSIVQQGPELQSLLVISVGYKKQGQALTITIAEDLNPIAENIDRFKYWFAVMSFSMLFVLVILQALILRRSLKPLTGIRSELKSLEQGRLDKLSTDSPSELRPLIDEVNHLLTIMTQRLRRSRDGLSDLAHAIKKPLTVIRQVIEKSNIPGTTKSTLIKQADDIYQLTDRILKRAHLAGHSHTGALFSFSRDLPALLKTLDMMYAGKTLQLTTEIPEGITCPVDREDMLELLGNLLDNAYKWAAHKIVLSVRIESGIHICIEDDGPGADPEKINTLSGRGVRLDEKMQGHGFGLAIATDMVSDYGGSIRFTRSTKLGGFKSDIELPVPGELPIIT